MYIYIYIYIYNIYIYVYMGQKMKKVVIFNHFEPFAINLSDLGL